MNRTLRKFIVGTAMTLGFAGAMGLQPAFASNPIVVTSSADSHGEAHVSSTVRQTINGVPVVSDMRPEKSDNAKISAHAIKDAPVVHVNTSMTSETLYRKSHHAKFVLVVGTWLNDGKLGNITAGFPVTSRAPGAVMVLNKQTHKYEHGFSLWKDTPASHQKAADEGRRVVGRVKLHGKWFIIVTSCFNDFHGHFDVSLPQAILVHVEGEIEETTTIAASAHADAKAVASGTCPNGTTVYAEATASSSASTSATLTYKIKFRAAVVEGKKAELKLEMEQSASADATAKAEAKITIDCGGVTYQLPTLDASAAACVNQGETTGVINASGSNPNTVAAPGSFTLAGGSTHQVGTVNPGATATTQFTGLGVGTYTVTFALGSPINLSVSRGVTVNQCDNPPPSVSITAGTLNDLFQCEHSPNWKVTPSISGGGPYKVRFTQTYGQVKDTSGNVVTTYPVNDSTPLYFVYYAPCDPGTTTILTEHVKVELLNGANQVVASYQVPDFILKPKPGNPPRPAA